MFQFGLEYGGGATDPQGPAHGPGPHIVLPGAIDFCSFSLSSLDKLGFANGFAGPHGPPHGPGPQGPGYLPPHAPGPYTVLPPAIDFVSFSFSSLDKLGGIYEAPRPHGPAQAPGPHKALPGAIDFCTYSFSSLDKLGFIYGAPGPHGPPHGPGPQTPLPGAIDFIILSFSSGFKLGLAKTGFVPIAPNWLYPKAATESPNFPGTFSISFFLSSSVKFGLAYGFAHGV